MNTDFVSGIEIEHQFEEKNNNLNLKKRMKMNNSNYEEYC